MLPDPAGASAPIPSLSHRHQGPRALTQVGAQASPRGWSPVANIPTCQLGPLLLCIHRLTEGPC